MVKAWKASKLARDTYILERAEVWIGKNMESTQASKGYLHSGEGRGRLELVRTQANKGHLLSGEDRGWDLFEHYNKASQ